MPIKQELLKLRPKKESIKNRIDIIGSRLSSSEIFSNMRKFVNEDRINEDYPRNEYYLINNSIDFGYKNKYHVGIFYNLDINQEYDEFIHSIYVEHYKDDLIDFYYNNGGEEFINKNLIKIITLLKKKYTFEMFLKQIALKTDDVIVQIPIKIHSYPNIESTPKGKFLSFDPSVKEHPSFYNYTGYILKVLTLFQIDPIIFRRAWNDKNLDEEHKVDKFFYSEFNYKDVIPILNPKDLVNLLSSKYSDLPIYIFCKIKFETLINFILERAHKVVIPRNSIVTLFSEQSKDKFLEIRTTEEFLFDFKKITIENAYECENENYSSYRSLYKVPKNKEIGEITKFVSKLESERLNLLNKK
jgi:hypothetical protein